MAQHEPPMMDRRAGAERRSVPHDAAQFALSQAERLALMLLLLGAVQVALRGVFDIDLLAMLFGAGHPAARLLSGLIGLAGLYALWMLARLRRKAR